MQRQLRIDADLPKLYESSRRRSLFGVTNMTLKRGSVACPNCSCPVEVNRSVFRSDFRCPHCDAALRVSPGYLRWLGLLSLLLGVALAWEMGSRGPRNCLLGIPWAVLLLYLPLAFLVLTLLVRIVPFLIKPTLVLRQPFDGHMTTLNLTPDPKGHTRV